jgi:hypothetical protein
VRRPTGRHARRAALGLLLALGLARCATPRPIPPAAVPIPPGQAVELGRRWAAEWESFRGMRAAIDLTVKGRRGSERAAALLLVAPTALRVEVATPFGLPALVATAGPDDITIFRVLERRAETARPSPAAMERWLGVAVPPTTLVRLLVGNIAPPRDPATIVVESAPSPHLSWTEDGVRHQVWVSAEGRPVRLLLETTGPGQEPLGADFEWSATGGLAGVRLEAPGRGAELTVRYLSAENIQPPPDAFRLTLPPDIPVQRVD